MLLHDFWVLARSSASSVKVLYLPCRPPCMPFLPSTKPHQQSPQGVLAPSQCSSRPEALPIVVSPESAERTQANHGLRKSPSSERCCKQGNWMRISCSNDRMLYALKVVCGMELWLFVFFPLEEAHCHRRNSARSRNFLQKLLAHHIMRAIKNAVRYGLLMHIEVQKQYGIYCGFSK
jgi:hypothetical protein